MSGGEQWMQLSMVMTMAVAGGCSSATTTTFPISDPTGEALTIIDGTEPVLALNILITPLGTNGRHCESCHPVLNGWVLTPSDDLSRFNEGRKDPAASDGGEIVDFADNATATSNDQLDPLFRINDGATSPNDDVSTPQARTSAYVLLFSKALIRIGLAVPEDAGFALTAVDDPYEFASATQLSLFRRTLPMTNLAFEQTIMWDGRESVAGATVEADLAQQASDATTGHAQALAAPDAGVLSSIVGAESSTYFAQEIDADAGNLSSDGARGGPANLSQQAFYAGINAFPGPDPMGVPFSPQVFVLFDSWAGSSNSARASIARGEALFNSRTFTISGVSGLNDELGANVIQGTCGSCHNSPNVGTNSLGLLFDVGISDAARRSSDVPLYTFVDETTGMSTQRTDPGRALITGRWQDMGRFKVPGLRGLAARAPYFHDGSAGTLNDVLDYLDARFSIGLNDSEKADLVAFMNAL